MGINDIKDGMRFGRLTVMYETKRRGPNRYWLCRCDCGKVKAIRGSSLVRDECPTRSCGCMLSEKMRTLGPQNLGDSWKPQVARNMEVNTNLQIICTSEPPKNNHSGHKGVWYDPKRGRWLAYLNIHNKRVYLGRYRTYREAVKAREEGEQEYYRPILESLNKSE